MKPFNDISSVITELQNALACAARIFALLEEEPESADSKDTITDVRGEVNIDNVCFRYVPDKKLIENFNLHAEQASISQSSDQLAVEKQPLSTC